MMSFSVHTVQYDAIMECLVCTKKLTSSMLHMMAFTSKILFGFGQDFAKTVVLASVFVLEK